MNLILFILTFSIFEYSYFFDNEIFTIFTYFLLRMMKICWDKNWKSIWRLGSWFCNIMSWFWQAICNDKRQIWNTSLWPWWGRNFASNDLLSIGLTQSDKFSKIINSCFEAQLDGKFSTHSGGMEFLQKTAENYM